MKREIGLLLTAATCAGLWTSGCVSSHRTVVVRERPVVPPAEVVVSTEPPPLRHEVIGVAPSPEHVWIDGYWTWRNDHWVWHKGHWERRPTTQAVWVPGHWDRTSRGWLWRPGHWA